MHKCFNPVILKYDRNNNDLLVICSLTKNKVGNGGYFQRNFWLVSKICAGHYKSFPTLFSLVAFNLQKV